MRLTILCENRRMYLWKFVSNEAFYTFCDISIYRTWSHLIHKVAAQKTNMIMRMIAIILPNGSVPLVNFTSKISQISVSWSICLIWANIRIKSYSSWLDISFWFTIIKCRIIIHANIDVCSTCLVTRFARKSCITKYTRTLQSTASVVIPPDTTRTV